MFCEPLLFIHTSLGVVAEDSPNLVTERFLLLHWFLSGEVDSVLVEANTTDLSDKTKPRYGTAGAGDSDDCDRGAIRRGVPSATIAAGVMRGTGQAIRRGERVNHLPKRDRAIGGGREGRRHYHGPLIVADLIDDPLQRRLGKKKRVLFLHENPQCVRRDNPPISFTGQYTNI